MNEVPSKKPPVQSFQMTIDSVRTITGRGTLVSGKIRQGTVRTGDSVTITGPSGKSTSSVVTGVEMTSRLVGSARAGDTVGVLLRGVRSQDVAKGHVLRSA